MARERQFIQQNGLAMGAASNPPTPGMLTLLAATGITAGTTRTQAGATQLTAQGSRVDTATPVQVTVAAASSFTTSSTTIAMGSANTGNVQPGAAVYDNTAGAYVGQVLTYTGTTLTLAAASAINSSGSTDSLVFNYGSVVGDGVALPVSVAGLDIEVTNNTANPIQVYPAVGDSGATINGIAAAAGVALPPGDVARFTSEVAGDWRFEAGVGSYGAFPLLLAAENVVASATISQAAATVLPSVVNHVTVVPAGGGAVALPAAVRGLEIAIENSSANALTVYPANSGADTINGQAANAPIVIPGKTTALLRATSGGVWQSDPFFNGVGAVPSTGGVQPGLATTGLARSGGNLYVYASAAGQNMVGASASTDYVLGTYTLPANALDVVNRMLTINAAGNFANNAHTKTLKFWVGTDAQTVGNAVVTTATTAIAPFGGVTTTNVGWAASVQGVKTGSNAQVWANAEIVTGTTHGGTLAPVATSLADTGAIVLTITGQTGTAASAVDIVLNMLQIQFNN